MTTGTKVVLGLLGVMVVGGGVIYFTSKSSSNASPQPSPQPQAGNPNAITASNPTAAGSPCDNANRLAAIARASPNPSQELQSYQYWAAQCTAQGGTPSPFPS